MADVRDVWRKSHGYTAEMLEEAATDLEWLLDDPRYQDPKFEPPPGVRMFFGLGQKMEAEAIRMISDGPPYVPQMELEGSFAMSQIQAFFPARWVEFLKRMGMAGGGKKGKRRGGLGLPGMPGLGGAGMPDMSELEELMGGGAGRAGGVPGGFNPPR